MRLSELTQQTKTISVEWNGHIVEVEYRVHFLTPAFVQMCRAGVSVANELRQIVTRWSIEDDDGQELSVEDSADNLPGGLLQAIEAGIMHDMAGPAGDEAEKKD